MAFYAPVGHSENATMGLCGHLIMRICCTVDRTFTVLIFIQNHDLTLTLRSATYDFMLSPFLFFTWRLGTYKREIPETFIMISFTDMNPWLEKFKFPFLSVFQQISTPKLSGKFYPHLEKLLTSDFLI